MPTERPVFPIILCGGSGSRLWPESRPGCPKQFLPLIDSSSTFDNALARAAGLPGSRAPLVVGGSGHVDRIKAHAAAAGHPVRVIAEPAPRDTAAAIAAASVLAFDEEPDAIAAVLPADHWVPDAAAFRAAMGRAIAAAGQGSIVLLGVRPSSASSAYGYIKPRTVGPDASPVEGFVEKPDPASAEHLLRSGWLWNSGNFVFPVRLMLEELEALRPDILAAAHKAVQDGVRSGTVLALGSAFRNAPRISIDYAVMEKTRRTVALVADFAWSDLGAWNAIWAASPKDSSGNAQSGEAQLIGSRNCLVRNGGGLPLAVIGGDHLAVVRHGHAVLVCDLRRSEEVKSAAAHWAHRPVALQEAADHFTAAPDGEDAGSALDRWLRVSALPLWWALGADHSRGGFHEVLDLGGVPLDLLRRARVQARQAYAFAEAGLMGWPGPWAAAADWGLDFLERCYRRRDGLYRSSVAPDGSPVGETATLCDQAFVLLAMARRFQADPRLGHLPARAEALLRTIRSWGGHEAGGFREAGESPFQGNAQMHLLEACLAWTEAAGQTGPWQMAADEIVALALGRLIDRRTGAIREHFRADWSPAAGAAGQLVEPGHQFEWAALIEAWAEGRGDAQIHPTAARLFAAGLAGLDPMRGVVVDELDEDLGVRSARARLWPQAERLKAALVLARRGGADAEQYRAHAVEAARALGLYLKTAVPGLWHDKLLPDGRFVSEPAPASSLYHLIGAISLLSREAAGRSRFASAAQ